MTDQGQGYPQYGEPGAGGEPQYPTQQFPQQPQYPGQPGYGQQPPSAPQYPGQPGYGQPQYPTEQFAQQPPYPGQPGYGTPPPGYPPPGYGGPGGPTGPGGPGGVGASGGGKKGLLAGIIAAAVVAAAVVAYFIFSGGSASASSPKEAVRKLLNAGKNNDVSAAKKVLCKGDLALGTATKLGSRGRITSYTIGKTSKKNGITVIEVTASTTQNPTPSSAEFPVVKEGGSWKVCFTKALSNLPPGVPTGLPTGLPTSPTSAGVPTDTGVPTGTGFPTSLPTSLPSGLSICSSSNEALSAAEAYIGAAEVGLTQFAQSCVYHDSVPLSVTTSLSGKLYGPDPANSNTGPFKFKSLDGATSVTITVTKESDGHFYITGVQKG